VPSDAPTGVLGLVIENIRASIVIWISDFGIARPAGPNLQSTICNASVSRSFPGAKPPPPAPRVQVAKVEIQSGVTEKAVKQPIEKQLAELVNAYSSELSSQPGLAGKMVVEFTVGANGLVRDVKVVQNGLNPSLGQTVTQFLKKLKMTNSSGSDATVKLTLNFKP
jgi:TonB family protein